MRTDRGKLFSLSTSLCGVLSVGSALAVGPVLLVGPEEALPGGAGRLPGIATDSRNQPHIVFDGDSFAYMYDKIGGVWRAAAFDCATVGSGQFFNPHVEIDRYDRAWCSGVLFGSTMGIGIILRTDMTANPSAVNFSAARIQGVFDVGNLSLDPALPDEAVAYSADGYYQRRVYDVTAPGGTRMSGSGQMFAGQGGEKNAFWISKAGSVPHADGTRHAVWHGAIGGWNRWSSSYQSSVRAAQNLPTVTWAAFSSYGTMADDGVYVSVAGDNRDPLIAYITCAFIYSGVHVNIFNGHTGQMLRPPEAIWPIDRQGQSGLRRFAPQLAPARDGGVFLAWTHADTLVQIVYIAPNGQRGQTIDVGYGGRPAICTDRSGNVHVAYTSDGAKYRRILVVGGGASSRAGDFNGDGADDLAVYMPSTGDWYIHALNGPVLAMPMNWGFAGTVPVPGDYDGDGRDDLAVYEPATGNWFILTMAGSVLALPVNWGFAGAVPVPGDYDGDGRDDLAVYEPATGNWFILTMAGSVLALPVNWGFAGTVPVPGDYDGDGRDDLAVYEPATGNWFILTMAGAVLALGENWGYAGTIPVPGDYNRDGKHELAVFDPVNGNWWIRELSGRVLAGPVNWGFAGVIPVVGDFDANADHENAVYEPATGNWYIRTMGGAVLAFPENWGFGEAQPIGGRN